jgi:hypothetical protein
LIWPNTFSARLESWNQLRDQVQHLPLETALADINSWWFQTPWRPYYLHWDDQADWPDPWQLLSDDTYCEVARGLGILYTITLLDRADMAPVDMILTDDGTNLVRVAKEKYILNWEPDSIVNTNQEIKIKRQYQQRQIT